MQEVTKKFSLNSFASLVRNAVRTANWVRKEDPFYFYAGVTLNLSRDLLPFATAYFSAQFINHITQGTFSSVLDPTLFWIVAGYIITPVMNSQASIASNYLFTRFRLRFEQIRDLKLYEKLSDIDIQLHENSEFNNLATKVEENLYRIMNFYFFGVQPFFLSLITAIVAFVILAHYNFIFACVLCVALLPQLYIQMRYGQRTWGIWGSKAEIRRKYAEYRRPFYNTAGLVELRVYRIRQYFLDAIRDLLDIFNGEVEKVEKSRFYTQFAAALFLTTVFGTATVILMNSAIAGSIAIGSFLFILGRMSDLRSQINDLISNISMMTTDNLFITDFYKLMDTAKVLKEGTVKILSKTPEIVFSNVFFSYPNANNEILRDISFTVRPGEKVAIVGVNGVGKTTLTKLLMRFYDPSSGAITIDGTPLNTIQSDSWLAHIAYLPQDYAYYRFPVKEMIALGNPNVPLDEGRVREAAVKAGADEFITKWPKGYDTPLGKEFDGEEPSIGQKQKLALARMFYKRANILILDEPTSSIDAIAELAIFNELENLPDDTSVILISHRFNTVKNADKIIVIEHGTIAEMGTHEELMQKKGHYHTLFTSQKDSYGTEA